jgi:hypothetical protein
LSDQTGTETIPIVPSVLHGVSAVGRGETGVCADASNLRTRDELQNQPDNLFATDPFTK